MSLPRPVQLPRLALAGLAAGLVLAAAAPATPGDDAATTQPGADLPDLKPIMTQLGEIRGLEFVKDVPAEVQSVDDWKDYVVSQLEAFLPEDRREGIQQGLLRLGLLLEPIDFGEELVETLLSQAGAYYDPTTGSFYYLMSELPPEMLKTVAAHELVHALQDQHFDLGALMEELEGEYTTGVRNDDRMLAFRFLVEGEATYVQTLWQMKHQMGMDLMANPQMEQMSLKRMADLDSKQLAAMARMMLPDVGEDDPIMKAMREIENIPPYFLEPLYAAYMKGAYFTMSLRQAGGWEGLSATYGDLPRSSEQALHVEKFTGDGVDEPTPVELPALASLEADGWAPIDAAIHGELYLNLLLRNFDVPRETAADATAGWDGDVYRAWRNDEGRVLFALATTWDSGEDASQFESAYREVIAARYGEQAAASDADPHRYACGDDLGHGRLDRRGREVFVVEGGSAEAVDRVMTALLAVKIDHVD